MMNDRTLYTLVQHSGYTAGQKTAFKQAVEERSITTVRQQARVAKLGGLLIEGYSAAYSRAEKENYPPGVTGLIPKAQGTFSSVLLEGSPVYIPAKEA